MILKFTTLFLCSYLVPVLSIMSFCVQLGGAIMMMMIILRQARLGSLAWGQQHSKSLLQHSQRGHQKEVNNCIRMQAVKVMWHRRKHRTFGLVYAPRIYCNRRKSPAGNSFAFTFLLQPCQRCMREEVKVCKPRQVTWLSKLSKQNRKDCILLFCVYYYYSLPYSRP